MASDKIERNARALKTLGVIGAIATICLAWDVVPTVVGSDDTIAALRENSSQLLLILFVAFGTVRNFQIAGSLRKQ